MVSPHDRQILHELGRRKCEIGHLPIQQENFERWRRLNRLDPVRPMVWINEIPWHEMNVDGVLDPRCEDPFLQIVEVELRR